MASSTSAPCQAVSSPPTGRAWMLAGWCCFIVSSGFLLATNKHVHRAAIHLTESHNMQVEPSKRASPSYACPLPYCPFTTNRCHEQTKKHHEKRRTVPDINMFHHNKQSGSKQISGREWSVGMLPCTMCKIFLSFSLVSVSSIKIAIHVSPVSRRRHKITMEEFLTNQHKLR